MPDFDLSDSGGLGLVLLRGLVDYAVLMVFGLATLRVTAIRAAAAHLPTVAAIGLFLRLRRLSQIQSALAAVTLGLWVIGVAQSLSGAHDWNSLLSATGTVLAGTSFGKVVIAQVGTLIVVAGLAMFETALAAIAGVVVTTLLIVLEAMHGHAFSMGDAGLYIATVLHLLAAGAWLGSLPVLAWLAWRLPIRAATALLRAFSPIGQIAVLLIAVTALLQGLVMIQTVHSLITTAYGWTALFKLLLFGLLLILASFNRFYGTPRLGRGAVDARRALLISLAFENVAGLAVLLAAGLLASLPPVMAMAS